MPNTLERPKLPYASRKDIIKIFKLIHERKEPKLINEQKLKTLDIGSPIYVISMLKTFGFLNDEDNTLNSSADDLRGTPEKFSKCLENKVKEVYNDLFDTVRDALSTTEEQAVKNYFRDHIKDVKVDMLEKIANCFLTLRSIINNGGNFESLELTKTKTPKVPSVKPKQDIVKNTNSIQTNNTDAKNIKLILNLNINLDIGTSTETIEGLFKNISLAHKAVFGDEK